MRSLDFHKEVLRLLISLGNIMSIFISFLFLDASLGYHTSNELRSITKINRMSHLGVSQALLKP